MSRRRIGQEAFGFAQDSKSGSTLDALSRVIDWPPSDRHLAVISSAAKGEPAWPPLALFKAMLLAIWYDLSDVKLAEALDGRSSFRRFCGFSRYKVLFDEITPQLKAKAIKVKTGTLVDATIIAPASKDDTHVHWVKHREKPAAHGYKALVGADADTALVEEVAVTPANTASF